MFWALASTSWAGLRLSTQLKTKAMTKSTRIQAVPRRVWEAFCSAMSP